MRTHAAQIKRDREADGNLLYLHGSHVLRPSYLKHQVKTKITVFMRKHV